jgi:hypothetical protein
MEEYTKKESCRPNTSILQEFHEKSDKQWEYEVQNTKVD